MKDDLLQLAIDFVKAIEAGNQGANLKNYYHKDIEHTEFPNLLAQKITTRNLEELKAASQKGKQVISKQTYDIRNSCQAGHTVILEVYWAGTLAIPLGNLKPGEKMEAYFAQFFEFKDGLIYRQRNYDCFLPFQ